ncbi:MAG: hypothetical protein ABJQ29_05585 [Luteolibacter sp.]
MRPFSARRFLMISLVVAGSLGAISCASKETDKATPTAAKKKDIGDFMAKDGGYKQDESGNWVPNSDKRSSFDKRKNSPFSKDSANQSNETYKTGDYAKKSWWGSKEYGSKEYAGNTDGSRFSKEAKQNGQAARGSNQGARESGAFETKTLDSRSARESNTGSVDRGSSSYVESARSTYQAPSVIDWKAQRSMSRDQSRSILGR